MAFTSPGDPLNLSWISGPSMRRAGHNELVAAEEELELNGDDICFPQAHVVNGLGFCSGRPRLPKTLPSSCYNDLSRPREG